VEKTLKVSPGIYAQVTELADKGGLAYKLVADELMREGLRHLNTVSALAEAVEADPNIRVSQEDGVVYYCEECGQLLDIDEKPDVCPNPKCGVKIDWEHKPGGGGMGLVGWGLVGLAIFLALGSQGRTARL